MINNQRAVCAHRKHPRTACRKVESVDVTTLAAARPHHNKPHIHIHVCTARVAP